MCQEITNVFFCINYACFPYLLSILLNMLQLKKLTTWLINNNLWYIYSIYIRASLFDDILAAKGYKSTFSSHDPSILFIAPRPCHLLKFNSLKWMEDFLVSCRSYKSVHLVKLATCQAGNAGVVVLKLLRAPPPRRSLVASLISKTRTTKKNRIFCKKNIIIKLLTYQTVQVYI